LGTQVCKYRSNCPFVGFPVAVSNQYQSPSSPNKDLNKVMMISARDSGARKEPSAAKPEAAGNRRNSGVGKKETGNAEKGAKDASPKKKSVDQPPMSATGAPRQLFGGIKSVGLPPRSITAFGPATGAKFVGLQKPVLKFAVNPPAAASTAFHQQQQQALVNRMLQRSDSRLSSKGSQRSISFGSKVPSGAGGSKQSSKRSEDGNAPAGGFGGFFGSILKATGLGSDTREHSGGEK
jgi:hypothetical protein